MFHLAVIDSAVSPFPYKGRWKGTILGKRVNQNITLFLRKTNTSRYHGKINGNGVHTPMVPSKIEIRETRVGRAFILLAPSFRNGKFMEFEYNSLDPQISTSTSFDGNWNGSVAIFGNKRIEFNLTQIKKGNTYRYSLDYVPPGIGAIIKISTFSLLFILLCTLIFSQCRNAMKHGKEVKGKKLKNQ